MTPLPIDERRITKLAQACDLIEQERPHGPFWKLRKAKAYAELKSRPRRVPHSHHSFELDT